jgi:class 3 adenylate cyclase
MAEEPHERRLAAILAVDVVGYSRLTGVDEEGTIRRLRALREQLIDPAIEKHRGRVVKTMGDGILIEFASAVDAVRSFLNVQLGARERNAGVTPENRIELRVGVHVGDVIVQPDGDLLGDGVNITARLEGIAEPGGICLSEDAYRQVRDRLKEEFVDLGEKKLKNIARPLRVYSVRTSAAVSPCSNLNVPNLKYRDQVHAEAVSSRGFIKTNLPTEVRLPSRGVRIRTAEEAIKFIDRNLPAELLRLPRWSFARALFVEAIRTGKSRDVNAGLRQFRQALRNERWLDVG